MNDEAYLSSDNESSSDSNASAKSLEIKQFDLGHTEDDNNLLGLDE